MASIISSKIVTAKSRCPDSDLISCPETAHLGV